MVIGALQRVQILFSTTVLALASNSMNQGLLVAGRFFVQVSPQEAFAIRIFLTVQEAPKNPLFPANKSSFKALTIVESLLKDCTTNFLLLIEGKEWKNYL